ncbi:MAG: DUF952 domain-containing protein [Hyphomicrobium sp.]
MTHARRTPSERAGLVYKVVSAAEWHAAGASGFYGGSPDDIRDGFIHLSCAHQLAGTLAKYFRGNGTLVLIAFSAADLGPGLTFEASRGGDLFPHLYGPLPTAPALWQRPLQLGADLVPVVDEEWL